MDFPRVTPTDLQKATDANCELQRQTTARAVLKLVYEMIDARIQSLNSGVEDSTPNEFKVTIPPAYYRSKVQMSGVDLALHQLRHNGFNVSLVIEPEMYSDDSLSFVFITDITQSN